MLGSHLGSKMEPQRVHKGLLSQVGSPGGPRGSPGVDFGRIFDDVWSYFVLIFVFILDILPPKRKLRCLGEPLPSTG